LVPSKSYWYDIDFKWNPRKHIWEYKSIAELPGTLTLKDHRQHTLTLNRLEVSEAQETLGIWIAMCGNQTEQTPALRKLIANWADKNPHQARSVDLLTYGSLPGNKISTAKCLSKKDCTTLDSYLLSVALPALGFPAKFPHKIAYAPTSVLGLGIPSLWNDQNIDHT
jgi:hypothetical protein